MKALIVKTSSMGDVIHTLPAVTDAARAIPDIVLDWVVEEGFAEIPRWHPSLRRVIPLALRRWRKAPLQAWRSAEWKQFRQQLVAENYDVIIDAQGLIKSAWVAHLANGPVMGFDFRSAREPLATVLYHKKFFVSKEQHAVERTRALFAQALCYQIGEARGDCRVENAFHHSLGEGDFGLRRERFGCPDTRNPYVLFLHGTTRDEKHWPDEHWVDLCRAITDAGYDVRIPWYNQIEKARAEKIAATSHKAHVLPKNNLAGMATALAQAMAFVAVDTGLGHLASALDVPGVSLYGPTSPLYVGTYGKHQIHMGARVNPERNRSQPADFLRHISSEGVWRELTKLLDSRP